MRKLGFLLWWLCAAGVALALTDGGLEDAGGTHDIDALTGVLDWDSIVRKRTGDLIIDGVELDLEAGASHGWVRFAEGAGTPPGDCVLSNDQGRIFIDKSGGDNARFCVCSGTSGWKCYAAGLHTTDTTLDDDDYVRVDGTNPLTADWDAGAQTIDVDNVNSSTANTDLTLTGDGSGIVQVNDQLGVTNAGLGASIQNTTDAASNQVLRLLSGDRATPTDQDEGYLSFFNDDSDGTQKEFTRITWAASDVTNNSKNARFELALMYENALVDAFHLEIPTAAFQGLFEFFPGAVLVIPTAGLGVSGFRFAPTSVIKSGAFQSFYVLEANTTIDINADPGLFGSDLIFRGRLEWLIDSAVNNGAENTMFIAQPVIRTDGANIGSRTWSYQAGFRNNFSARNTGTGTTALVVNNAYGFTSTRGGSDGTNENVQDDVTLTNYFGFIAEGQEVDTAGGASIGTQHGYRIDADLNEGSTNIGLSSGMVASANDYFIKTDGGADAQSVHEGFFAIGGTADPTEALDLTGNIRVAGGSSTGYIDIGEFNTTSDAGAPADNRARLYVRDDGAGKEQLVVRFTSGAVQVLASEP